MIGPIRNREGHGQGQILRLLVEEMDMSSVR